PYQSRYLAEHIRHARWIEVPGEDYMVYTGDVGPMLDEIETFLTGERPRVDADRALATVLFTDIVSSTELARGMGDRAWRDVLGHFRVMVRDQLRRFGGLEVNTRGDDFLATFDGPARAVRCALAIREVVRDLHVDVRSGVHTGEVELLDGDIGG